jgi:hypothetical protein
MELVESSEENTHNDNYFIVSILLVAEIEIRIQSFSLPGSHKKDK